MNCKFEGSNRALSLVDEMSRAWPTASDPTGGTVPQ